MNIAEALATDVSIRVSCGYRWLIRDSMGYYHVLERKYRAHFTTECVTTRFEDEAVRVLMLGETND